jgi:prevent-host-death family protein
MTTTVNVHEAKTHLSRLLERAHAGEEIMLAKAGKPYARLMPLAADASSARTATRCRTATPSTACWRHRRTWRPWRCSRPTRRSSTFRSGCCGKPPRSLRPRNRSVPLYGIASGGSCSLLNGVGRTARAHQRAACRRSGHRGRHRPTKVRAGTCSFLMPSTARQTRASCAASAWNPRVVAVNRLLPGPGIRTAMGGVCWNSFAR